MKQFNKKAIMLDFLMTVLLALIIFIPACIFTSNLLRTSEQGQASFTQFAEEIKKVEKADQGKLDSFLLILDQETAVVYFEPHQQAVSVFVQGHGDIGNTVTSGENYDLTIQQPPSCLQDKACLCLVQEASTSRQYQDNFKPRCAGENCGLARIQGEATITPTKFSCLQDFKFRLKLKSCGFGARHNTQGYFCSHGFVIERNLIQKSGVTAYYSAPRRLALQLTKGDQEIILE